MIDAMFQEGTDAALTDQVQRPAAPKPVAPRALGWDAVPAAFQGIGAGSAKSMAFGAELVGAFGQVYSAAGTDSAGGMFSTQSPAERQASDRARAKVLMGGPDMSNAVGDAFRARAADILPDARTASTSAHVVAGLTDFATRAVGYTVGLGPVGPMAMGGDAALEESDRLKQQGVDIDTRTQAGAVAGVLNAVGVAAPMTGATAAARFVKGVAVGEGTIVGQSVAERAILKAAGYDKLAESFDPLDPVALALGLVPGALGAKFGHAREPARPQHAGAAAGFDQLQAATDAARTTPDRLGVLQAEMAKPETTARERTRLQGEIDKLRATAGEEGVARAVAADPDLVPAARVAQAAQALDATRLTPDADLVGRDAHVSAVEMAADQLGRGEDVQVAARLADTLLAPAVEAPELQAARALLASIDQGGIPLNPAKLRTALEALGIEVDRAAKPEDTVARIRQAVQRVDEQVQTSPQARVPQVVEAVDQLRTAREQVTNPNGARPVSPQNQPPPSGTKAAKAGEKAAKAETAPARGETKATAEPPARPQAASGAAGEGKAPASVERAAQEVAALDPDMLVHMEGMEAPMRVADLLARVKEEAAQDVKSGRLLEVAAECALRN